MLTNDKEGQIRTKLLVGGREMREKCSHGCGLYLTI